MCKIFYCGTIIFATHGGVGGHQPLALQNTKYVPTHIEVARAGGCSHAQINSPRPTECAQRDFDSQAPLLRFSTPPGMLMQLRLQEAPHPAPRTTKNEIRSHPHRGRARQRAQPRTHQLAESRRVCAARFRQPEAGQLQSILQYCNTRTRVLEYTWPIPAAAAARDVSHMKTE